MFHMWRYTPFLSKECPRPRTSDGPMSTTPITQPKAVPKPKFQLPEKSTSEDNVHTPPKGTKLAKPKNSPNG
eukprot:12916754-Prorocentrum_lima.AAC.1